MVSEARANEWLMVRMELAKPRSRPEIASDNTLILVVHHSQAGGGPTLRSPVATVSADERRQAKVRQTFASNT
jgi:hypothetical protein